MQIHLREGSLIWNLYVDEIPTELGKRALQEEVGDCFFGWLMTESSQLDESKCMFFLLKMFLVFNRSFKSNQNKTLFGRRSSKDG